MTEPAELAPREAATVILLRDGADGLDAWLMRRVPKMSFAAGMTVFPGGAVDPADSEAGPAESAAHLRRTAAQLATSVQHAAVLLRAAVRETIEEADVALPIESLRPWARWITPPTEPRRYDTYFFVAGLPEQAAPTQVGSEASVSEWLPVERALAEFADGSRPMLPPTVINLRLIAAYRSVAEVLDAAGARSIRPVRPVFISSGGDEVALDLGDGQVFAWKAT